MVNTNEWGWAPSESWGSPGVTHTLQGGGQPAQVSSTGGKWGIKAIPWLFSEHLILFQLPRYLGSSEEIIAYSFL